MGDWKARKREVGSRIGQAMHVAGFNQRSLAEALEVSQATVSRWLSGENLPDIDTVAILADTLLTSAVDLLWPVLGTDPTPPGELERAILAAGDIDQTVKDNLLLVYRGFRKS